MSGILALTSVGSILAIPAGRLNVPSIRACITCDGFFTASGEKRKINVNKMHTQASHRTCIILQNIFQLAVQNTTCVKQGHNSTKNRKNLLTHARFTRTVWLQNNYKHKC